MVSHPIQSTTVHWTLFLQFWNLVQRPKTSKWLMIVSNHVFTYLFLFFTLFFRKVNERESFLIVGRGELIIELSYLVLDKRITFIIPNLGDGLEGAGSKIFKLLGIKVIDFQIEVTRLCNIVFNWVIFCILFWIIGDVLLDSFSETLVLR